MTSKELAKKLRAIVDGMKVHPEDSWTIANLGTIIAELEAEGREG